MTNSMLPLAAVSLANGRPITTSLSVAEVFEKRHADVLRSIEDLKADCQEDFGQRNFALSSYINEQNKQQPMFTLTKDGFTLLAMGYTGAKAMAFKVAYISRFNEMEAQLQATQPTLTDRLRSSRFLLSFDTDDAIRLQEVPARAVLVNPETLADLIGDSGSVFSRSLLPRIIGVAAARLERPTYEPCSEAHQETPVETPSGRPGHRQTPSTAVHASPLAPIPPMDNAREGVIAYLRGCKYGLPKRSLTQRVWAFRTLTALQKEQLIHDLIEEGILQEVTYQTKTRPGKRLVLTGIRSHG